MFGSLLLRLFAAFTALVGLAMTVGGAMLVASGGSLYYLVAGVLLLLAAALLFARRRAGAWLFGVVLAGTVVWSIVEVGFDGWSLMPRLLMLSLMGLWLLAPWTQRPLTGGLRLAERTPMRALGLILIGAVASVALGAAGFAAFTRLPPDPLRQTGDGAFPQAKAARYAGDVGSDWPHFGGDRGGGRYTPLDQITPGNVGRLQVAWTADMGETPYTVATPLKIGGRIYTCNQANQTFALDAASGKLLWRHDAMEHNYPSACRGVAYYAAPVLGGKPCAERIITATSSAKLIALDAATGRLCADFGQGGAVDLRTGMGDRDGRFIPGYYYVTSAPAVVRGRVVVGGWVSDGQYWGETSGVIRAFDAVTGRFAWAWDMGNPAVHTEPDAGKTYTPATPNSWAPMSADETLGLVYFPTGNATPDYYGAQRRPFDDRFSSSVVAVHADTGELAWSFQTVHHDLWDYDVASQPTLVDFPDGRGGVRPGLIQGTKQGELFILDRTSGAPIFPVTETPVPQAGKVPEERLSPTQPRSNALPSFRGAKLREADMWGLTPLDQLYCRVMFSRARYEGPETPPGLDPSVNFPSSFGAVNWGSVSVDPERGVMVVNHNRFATYMQLLTRKAAEKMGLKPLPAYSEPKEVGAAVVQAHTAYAAYPRFWLTPLGVPCIAPPYGLISAVDLHSGKLLWSRRLGTAQGVGPLGLKFPLPIPMGPPTHGGSLVTRSGVVFIGASADGRFRAFDLRTGRLVWQARPPGGGAGSTPIAYTANGRQYVVVMAAGQPAVGSTPGTKMVAYALPR